MSGWEATYFSLPVSPRVGTIVCCHRFSIQELHDYGRFNASIFGGNDWG